MKINLFNLPIYFIVLISFLIYSTTIIANENSPSRGEVVLAAGNVWLYDHNKATRKPLLRGDHIFDDMTIETADGSATLAMEDNGIITVHPSSTLHIEIYDVTNALIRLHLETGHIDTKTGLSSQRNRRGYRLNTPFAALGIRGTEYSVSLSGNLLEAYVQKGEIVLSPFNVEFNCTANGTGPCDNPLSVALKGQSGSWLRFRQGNAIERVSGKPEFISSRTSNQVQTEGPRAAIYNAAGREIQPYGMHLEYLDYGSLSSSDTLITLINSSNSSEITEEPSQASTFFTDNNPLTLSESEYRDILRRITLKSYVYNNIGQFDIFNFEIVLSLNRSTSLWVDPSHKRMWGETASLASLFATRDWDESRLLWRALPDNLEQMSSNTTHWFTEASSNLNDLWNLTLNKHAIYFTPTDTNLNLSRFVNVWTEHLHSNTLQQVTNNLWTVSELHAKGEDNFTLTLNKNGESHEVHGKVDVSGVIFGADNLFTVKGHWDKSSAIIIIEDSETGYRWINGLARSGTGNIQNEVWTDLNRPDNIDWGRWSNFTDLSDDQLAIVEQLYSNPVSNSTFILNRPTTTDIPNDGSYSFALSSYEAVYKNEINILPAEISNAKLEVNFNSQSLNTSFDITAPGLQKGHKFNSLGVFNTSGEIVLFDPVTLANGEGFIGKNGLNASFLFELPVDDNSAFSGITAWTR